jgi:hypothetical protein
MLTPLAPQPENKAIAKKNIITTAVRMSLYAISLSFQKGFLIDGRYTSGKGSFAH